MDSTSSDIDINIFDNNGNNINIPPIKKETSDTDLYLNLIANPSKSKVDSVKSSSSSLNFDNDKKKSETSSIRKNSKHNSINRHNSSSSSDEEYFGNHNEHKSTYSDRKSDRRSDRRSDHNSDRRSDHRSDRRSDHNDSSDSSDNHKHSRAKYEDVQITPEKPKLTGLQLRQKKIDLLRKLCDLKSKGYALTKEYTFDSSIEEMEYEYDLLKSFADRRNGIKLYKNTIINITNLVEFFNDKYDPFGAQLNGWSEHMSVEVDSYDDVLEELYEKYKGAGKSLPPEIKLLILIGFSASAFHFSKKHMSNLPGSTGTSGTPLGGLQSGIAQKIASMGKEKNKFMSEQELNIERQKEAFREKDRLMKQNMAKSAAVSMPQQDFIPQMNQPTFSPPMNQPTFSQQMNQSTINNNNLSSSTNNLTNARAPVSFNTQNLGIPGLIPTGTPSQLIQSNDPRNLIQQNNTPEIKKNETVQDVLKRLHNREADTIDTQDETTINNDRLLSDTTASDSKKKGKKKKNLMSIF
jgi:hypothetical protein